MSTRIYNQTVATSQNALVVQTQTAFTYKGFDSKNFRKNFKLYDIDLVKQDILNHFYIRRGEKLENPQFGTIIWDILFEPFTQEVRELVAKNVEEIVNYDPRVAVNSVIVDSTDMGIRIEADLTYLPFNISERMTLNFDRENNIIS
jgi:phage baseplate assembly protein W